MGLGLEYTYPLTETGVDLFFGIDINYNALTSDFEDDLIDGHREYYKLDNVTFPKYFNIPVSAGLNYTFEADENLSVYTNLGLAYNFLKMTDFTFDAPGEKWTTTYDLADTFGVKIGGGILLKNKIYISLNYFSLGRHKIKYKSKSSANANPNKGSLQSEINMVTLTVGFRFEFPNYDNLRTLF